MSTTITPKKKKTKAGAKPAVHKSKHKVQLKLSSKDAKRVSVAGGFNGWHPQPLGHNGDGTWSIDIELPPGTHEYLFVVDDEWLPDPFCLEGRPNPFGGENSVLKL